MDNETEATLVLPMVVPQGVLFVPRPILFQDEDGNPINLTGYEARMQIRSTPEASGPALVDISSSTGGITLGGTSGVISISTSATFVLIAGFQGYYDLVLYAAGVPVEKVIRGPICVEDTVTR